VCGGLFWCELVPGAWTGWDAGAEGLYRSWRGEGAADKVEGCAVGQCWVGVMQVCK
jgi:hypothetical protein